MPKTYQAIASQTLGANAASVTFSSIPNTYTDLRLVIKCKSSASSTFSLYMRFNGDTNTNYSSTNLYGWGSMGSDRLSNNSSIYIGYQVPSNAYGQGYICADIMSYANTGMFKTVLDVWESQQGLSSDQAVGRTVGLWRSANAVTQIDLAMVSGNIVSGATFSLYGIKAA